MVGTGPVGKTIKQILEGFGSAVSVKYLEADTLAVVNDYELKVLLYPVYQPIIQSSAFRTF